MAAKQYLDMSGLQKYDGLIKAKITTDVNAAKDSVGTQIGTLADLNTTAKSDLVSAVNEVRTAVSTGGTEAQVTISTETTTSGMVKSYTFKQGENIIGVIDIPKDMVVSSGQVVKNPEGEETGTYLELTLANATADKILINVGTLVDIYTVQASATQIQLVINPVTREISASIVAGSVGTTELADAAVTTIKLADGNVTKAKLSTDVQASLDKADSAVQTVAAGTADGTISVDGTNITIPGYSTLASDVENLKETTYEPITNEAIDALFAAGEKV